MARSVRSTDPGANINNTIVIRIAVFLSRKTLNASLTTLGLAKRSSAIAMPTLAIVAPPISDFDPTNREHWLSSNALILRNTYVANFLDRPAITLPCHEPGGGPVGLMLVGPTMGDAELLRLAAGVEQALTN